MDQSIDRELTDEQWEAPLNPLMEAMIDAAIKDARDLHEHEVAEEAHYAAAEHTLRLTMKSGQRVVIPVEDLQGLAGADQNAVANFELVGSGSALHWEQLDVDFRVEGLVKGLYGNEAWMKRLEEKRRCRLYATLVQTG